MSPRTGRFQSINKLDVEGSERKTGFPCQREPIEGNNNTRTVVSEVWRSGESTYLLACEALADHLGVFTDVKVLSGGSIAASDTALLHWGIPTQKNI